MPTDEEGNQRVGIGSFAARCGCKKRRSDDDDADGRIPGQERAVLAYSAKFVGSDAAYERKHEFEKHGRNAERLDAAHHGGPAFPRQGHGRFFPLHFLFVASIDGERCERKQRRYGRGDEGRREEGRQHGCEQRSGERQRHRFHGERGANGGVSLGPGEDEHCVRNAERPSVERCISGRGRAWPAPRNRRGCGQRQRTVVVAIFPMANFIRPARAAPARANTPVQASVTSGTFCHLVRKKAQRSGRAGNEPEAVMPRKKQRHAEIRHVGNAGRFGREGVFGKLHGYPPGRRSVWRFEILSPRTFASGRRGSVARF